MEEVNNEEQKRTTSNRLKRRLDKDVTLEDLLVGWTQCCYLVPRKQKLCNVARTGSSMYCGNHQPSTNKEESTNDMNDERVPCPIDGSHTIFKRNLQRHIKVCTKAKENNLMTSLPYFKKDCNSGSVGVDTSPSDQKESIDPEQLAVKVRACFQRITASDSPYQYQDNSAGESPASVPDTVKTVVAEAITASLGQELSSQNKLRHVDQDILLAQQMIAHGLLCPTIVPTVASTNTSAPSSSSAAALYVELGAGRGLLSHAVSCADPTATMVLVERSGSRRKVDHAMRESFAEQKSSPDTTDTAAASGSTHSTLVKGAIRRARMDIRHCYLPNLPGIAPLPCTSEPDVVTDKLQLKDAQTSTSSAVEQPVVVIAKHLCGVATDLALHSVGSFPHISRSTCSTTQTAAAHRVGITIATCCHHACHFPDYTGREWYLAQGFTVGEFEVLKKWSGWANSGSIQRTTEHQSSAGADEEHSSTTAVEINNHIDPSTLSSTREPAVMRPTGITFNEMKELGWQVKRIIDQGRVEYLNSTYNMQARQLRYCTRELSPECVMIIATQERP